MYMNQIGVLSLPAMIELLNVFQVQMRVMSHDVSRALCWSKNSKYTSRLEICQKNYTTKFSGERNLHTENA